MAGRIKEKSIKSFNLQRGNTQKYLVPGTSSRRRVNSFNKYFIDIPGFQEQKKWKKTDKWREWY
ncbi:hypothetical protein HYW21_06135 [Candidatus Woesearchaeota archaeon]|nr:hypothetical protein [Candidatus Woesearchaeota archaeon]